MEWSIWAIFLMVAKLGIYISTASAVASLPVIRLLNLSKPGTQALADASLKPVIRYMTFSICLGFFATGLAFFVQAGAMADQGLAGLWSPLFNKILWGSSVGDSTAWRLIGFALILATLWLYYAGSLQHNSIIVVGSWMLWSITISILAYAFMLTGHTAELNTWTRVALAIHVLGIAWWLGALWPLWSKCSDLDTENLHGLMHRFGKQASYVVALVISAGLLMAIQLLDSIEALWITAYGQVLSIKLIAVATILLFALYHKMRLVPSLLSESGTSKRLAKSIQIESVIGLSILVATAALTTLTGPG